VCCMSCLTECDMLLFGSSVTQQHSRTPPPWCLTPVSAVYAAVLLQRNVPAHIRWTNDLVDAAGGYSPHLLRDSIDQTIHW
jgi:hypothetical protein